MFGVSFLRQYIPEDNLAEYGRAISCACPHGDIGQRPQPRFCRTFAEQGERKPDPPLKTPDACSVNDRSGCLASASLGSIYRESIKQNIFPSTDNPEVVVGTVLLSSAALLLGFAKDNKHSARSTTRVYSSTPRLKAVTNYIYVETFHHPHIHFEGSGLVKRLVGGILVLLKESWWIHVNKPVRITTKRDFTKAANNNRNMKAL